MTNTSLDLVPLCFNIIMGSLYCFCSPDGEKSNYKHLFQDSINFF